MLLFISLFACTGDFAIPRLMEDTGDVAEDTGEVIEDTGENADDCRFELQTTDGTAEFGNELYQILSAASPKDKVDEGATVEIMRFNMSATEGDCKMLWVTDLVVDVNITDNEGTDWTLGNEILIKNLSTGNVVMGPMYYDGTQEIVFTDDFGVEAGYAYTFGVFLDTTGAGIDDMAQAEIVENGVTAEDVNGVHKTLLTDPITGNTVMID